MHVDLHLCGSCVKQSRFRFKEPSPVSYLACVIPSPQTQLTARQSRCASSFLGNRIAVRFIRCTHNTHIHPAHAASFQTIRTTQFAWADYLTLRGECTKSVAYGVFMQTPLVVHGSSMVALGVLALPVCSFAWA